MTSYHRFAVPNLDSEIAIIACVIGKRLAHARKRAGLTQRELAARAGVPQSTVARIELGMMDPRVGTLDRLLRECGVAVEVGPRYGEGVDRSLIAERLKLTPAQRFRSFVVSANNVMALQRDLRRVRS